MIFKLLRGNLNFVSSSCKNSMTMFSSLAQDNGGPPRKCNYKRCFLAHMKGSKSNSLKNKVDESQDQNLSRRIRDMNFSDNNLLDETNINEQHEKINTEIITNSNSRLNSKKNSSPILSKTNFKVGHQFKYPTSFELKKSIRDYLLTLDEEVKRTIAIPKSDGFDYETDIPKEKYSWNHPPPKSAMKLKLFLDMNLDSTEQNIMGGDLIEKPHNKREGSNKLYKRGLVQSPRISPTKSLTRHFNFNVLPKDDGPLFTRYHHISSIRSKQKL